MTQTRPWFRKEPGARRNVGKVSFHFFARGGFRACGRDQRAFRSPFGNIRGPCLRALLQAKEAKGFSSAVQLGKADAPRFLAEPGRARLSKNLWEVSEGLQPLRLSFV